MLSANQPSPLKGLFISLPHNRVFKVLNIVLVQLLLFLVPASEEYRRHLPRYFQAASQPSALLQGNRECISEGAPWVSIHQQNQVQILRKAPKPLVSLAPTSTHLQMTSFPHNFHFNPLQNTAHRYVTPSWNLPDRSPPCQPHPPKQLGSCHCWCLMPWGISRSKWETGSAFHGPWCAQNLPTVNGW